MASILLFPFPEFGHVNPTFKLAKDLKRAGHHVSYLGLADFREYIQQQGFDFISVLESRYPTGVSGDRSAQRKVGRVNLITLDQHEASAQLKSTPFKNIEKEIAESIRSSNPDLLIVDYLIGGFAYVAAQELGIASVVLSVTLLEGLMLGEPAPDAVYRPLPVVVLCPEAFDFPGADRKPNRYYIGPSVDLQRQELGSFPWDALNASVPLIYCSLGSESHLYDQSRQVIGATIEAMRERPDWQLVISVGPYLNTADCPPAPTNTLIVNWAPQLEILHRATMMITHGGLGTIKECILLGVPMIVFPFRWDQPYNAARVVAHGLGLRGNINHVSARNVAAMIDALIGSPSFKRRTDAMSRIFWKSENSGKGVGILERVMAEHRSMSKPKAIPVDRHEPLSQC